MTVHAEGDLELGSDAVRAGNQDGVGRIGQVQGEQAAETADIGIDTGDSRSGNVALHEFDSTVACRDIHAGGFVGIRMRLHTFDLRCYSFPFQQ